MPVLAMTNESPLVRVRAGTVLGFRSGLRPSGMVEHEAFLDGVLGDDVEGTVGDGILVGFGVPVPIDIAGLTYVEPVFTGRDGDDRAASAE